MELEKEEEALLKRFAATLASAAVAAGLWITPAAEAETRSTFTTFVWEVTAPGEDGLNPRHDYLLGTMHVPIAAHERLPAHVQGYLVRSTAFMMEADLQAARPEVVSRFSRLAPGQTLQRLLPVRAWSRLVATARARGIPEVALSAMQPWYLSVMLSLEPAPEAPVMDEALRAWAEEGQLSIRFLETAEEQLAILDSVRMEEDVRQLLELLDDPAKAKQELEQLKASYRSGDLERLEALLFDEPRMRDYPDFYAKLFDERNDRWMPRLMQAIAEEDLFVAVGLGHLIGENGLVRQLKARGYRVELVAPADGAERPRPAASNLLGRPQPWPAPMAPSRGLGFGL